MPTSLHPQAKFDPIPPDIDLQALVDNTPNFRWVQRVSREQIRNLGTQEFEKLVQIHVIGSGKPLVIDGWDAVLPKWLFNVDWLESTYDKKRENVRDIPAATDIPMTTGHYLRSMRQLANQWTPHTFRDDRRQRLYLKDIDCPSEWREALQKIIHPGLFYLNENVSVSSTSARLQKEDSFHSEVKGAPAGDLMSSLPETMRAENLMCYIGHEGTYTPAHREMCASLGQNIMVETSDDGNGEKAGSSIWFMTESKDREVVREYFLSMLGHDIEIEKHFAQINAWKKAPFDVGTRTMKVAWNRTTVDSLDLALHEAIPKARLVCRDEQYKNKAIVYFTLQKYFGLLQQMEKNAESTRMSLMGIGHEIVRKSTRVRQLAGDFKRLFSLFTEILIDEAFAYKEKDVDLLPFETWRAMVIANDGCIDIDASPQPFEVARLKSGKKSVAQICQEALRRRPWKDITKHEEQVKSPSDSEPGEGDDKVRKKSKRKKKKGEVRRCHVCCHKDYSYRVHECCNPDCTEAYCYGVLYRAFDLMPQKVLEDEYWQCPKCLGICSCGSCRRSGNTNAYTPKNTLLGHDTRPIADDRSVEALVDFRVHNLSWLKAVGEESRSKDSRRMQRLREQADNAKAQEQTHQAEAEQAMPDDIGAAGVLSSKEEMRHAIDRDDRSESIQQSYFPEGDNKEATSAGLVDDDPKPSFDIGSAPDIAVGATKTLPYPDPSVFIRQRIGMGYYEQDDTPDKILFDPYQVPSADAVGLSEAGVPDMMEVVLLSRISCQYR
ncbi:JmjC domain-containing protein [Ophiocordyceps camponoti-floridani]|uniref:JmjC domain-containing protein n=1 Tax=Ophiocordyceps camponoti-floridani TaxID=2030778 RepID=A0A8H4Q3P0_9HYPO|nr:JmjC domain-containing protein [Ophiocordyceps camponoti-floridani]